MLLREDRVKEGVLEGILYCYPFVGVKSEQPFEQILGVFVKIVSK